MKPWMIWTGAGILGVALAAAMIPWVGVSIMPSDPLPEVDTMEHSAPTAVTREVRPELPPPPQVAPVVVDAPTGAPAAQPDPVAEPAEPATGNFKHPDRKAWSERLQEPDMVAARHLNSRWRELNYIIGKMDHDPAGDATIERMKELERDLQHYRRNPESLDIEELMARQDHIIGELQQTSYWNGDMARMVQDMRAATQTYRDTR